MYKNDKNLILAKSAGFCWGVERAIKMAFSTSERSGKKVYTYGPLIHNPQEIGRLEQNNILEIEDPFVLEKGSEIIIRTHGITPTSRKKLKIAKLNLTDTTCPLVAKVQGMIKKYANKGYTSIIVGNEGHAEVCGLIGFTNENYYVINSIEAVKNIPKDSKINLVAQTTSDRSLYESISEAIKQRFPDAIINDTICDATTERQTEVLELADKVDTMIVVGGKNSSNTRGLANIATNLNVKTFLIETADDIGYEDLKDSKNIAVTAGASTPSWVIEQVMKKIKTFLR